MAQAVVKGESVWVPRGRLGQDPAAHPLPFVQGTVVSVLARSVEITVPGCEAPKIVAVSAVHRHLGILSIRIGDFATEATLLDPLAKSVGQFCRLLLPDDYVRIFGLRSLDELTTFRSCYQPLATVVIMMGHGSPSAITFGVGGSVSGEGLANRLQTASPGATPKVFISLACQTGQAAFARAFSAWGGCTALLAPFHSIHGAVASQFSQTFLAYHLLDGKTVKVAFNRARERVAGAASFRMWAGGVLLGGPS